MPRSKRPDGRNPENSAAKVDVFPFLHDWETSLELKPTLAMLRANRSRLQLAPVFKDLQHSGSRLSVDEEKVATLTSEAGITDEAASRLLEDTLLITGWYYLPDRRAVLRLDEGSHLDDLAHASKYAGLLLDTLADASNIEELIRFLAEAEPDKYREINVHGLLSDLEQLRRAADRLVERSKPGKGGRKKEARRDLTLALLAEAAEEAFEETIRFIRYPERKDWKFKNAPGSYVASVMELLGWKEESVLVRVFSEMRRVPRVK